MARKTTIKAFEAWIATDENEAVVLDRISGGLTLQKTALAVKQPFTCLHGYFHSTPERLARYDAARRAWADAQMDEALEIADGVAEDRDAVSKAKLRVETRQNQAKAYNRERWGERVQVEKSVSVTVDAGPATRFLREMAKRELEVESLPALEAHGKAAG
jgi:hypothetical protein